MKKTDAFTLIELMIVVAIIAIVAAIAIPNLLESRMAANESNAIGALRVYASAQATWQKANYGGNKGYAGYNGGVAAAPTPGQSLSLLGSKELIPSAFKNATDANNAYQGYFFVEDTYAGKSWRFDYGLFAHPAVYSRSGINQYFIDFTGEVKAYDGETLVSSSNSISSGWYNP